MIKQNLKSYRFKLIIIFFSVLIISCKHDKNNENVLLFERYSESNNDDIFSLQRNEYGLIEITLRRAIYNYDDGFFDLKGELYIKDDRIVFNSTNQLNKEIVAFDFLPLLKEDTLFFKNDNIKKGDEKVTYSVLDTTFYSIPYQDTIYRINIQNYRYLLHNDNMVLFVGKKVGFIGRFVTLDNYILYINGNVFHDIYNNSYRLYEYYPRIE